MRKATGTADGVEYTDYTATGPDEENPTMAIDTKDQTKDGNATQSGDGFVLPEKFKNKSAEDVARSYLELEKTYGEKAKEWGDKAKLLEEIDQYGGKDKLVGWATYGWEAYQKAQKGDTKPAATDGKSGEFDPSAWAGQFENYADLDPKSQALQLFKAVWQLNQKYLGDREKYYAGEIEKAQKGLGNQWDIWRKVMSAARKNPKIDPDALLERMSQVATPDVDNILKLAMEGLTAPEDLQARIEQAVAAARATWQQEQDARNVNVLTRTGRPGPSLPDAPKNAQEENAAILKALTGR